MDGFLRVEDDEDEEEDDDMEVCPPGCDPSLYEKVCELREKRLEQEEVYADFQKGVEALKKENDQLIKKEKVIDKALRDSAAVRASPAKLVVEIQFMTKEYYAMRKKTHAWYKVVRADHAKGMVVDYAGGL